MQCHNVYKLRAAFAGLSGNQAMGPPERMLGSKGHMG